MGDGVIGGPKYSKAYSLIKLLRRSSSNIVLSIRKVTQDNKGGLKRNIFTQQKKALKAGTSLTK